MPQIDPNWFLVDSWVVVIIAICIVAFIAVGIIWGIKAHRQQVSAGKEDLVGQTAEVKIALEPKGVVFVEGERWTAILEKGRVLAGEEVIITKVDGLKLWVTKKE
ncbi:NfeD family protein [Chloroflexota bacterium]